MSVTTSASVPEQRTVHLRPNLLECRASSARTGAYAQDMDANSNSTRPQRIEILTVLVAAARERTRKGHETIRETDKTIARGELLREIALNRRDG